MGSIGAPQYITVQQTEAYAAQAGFNNSIVPKSKYAPGNLTQIQTIVGIAGAESHLNIRAYNPSDPNGGSYGLLQINGAHFHLGGTSEHAALDPLSAFQYAYVLSNHGQNFLPWGTFTNGLYRSNIPNIPTSATILPATGWWTFPRIDNLGQPDPFGRFPKPDSNIQVPDNYPIATILSGTVSGINNPNGSIDPWGAAVTLRLDNPINSLATHIAYLHLSKITVRLGQHVQVGDLVGYNGGNAAAGVQKVPLGVALYSGAYYGHDGWNLQTLQNLAGPLNIVPLLDSAKQGTLLQGYTAPPPYTSNTFLTTFFSTAKTTFTNITASISPNADVVVVLDVLDSTMQFTNPLEAMQGDPNPLDWFGEVAYAISLDFVALTLRALVLFLGVYMCFKVVNQLTNITGTVSKTAQAGADVAKLAIMAAG